MKKFTPSEGDEARTHTGQEHWQVQKNNKKYNTWYNIVKKKGTLSSAGGNDTEKCVKCHDNMCFDLSESC